MWLVFQVYPISWYKSIIYLFSQSWPLGHKHINKSNTALHLTETEKNLCITDTPSTGWAASLTVPVKNSQNDSWQWRVNYWSKFWVHPNQHSILTLWDSMIEQTSEVIRTCWSTLSAPNSAQFLYPLGIPRSTTN